MRVIANGMSMADFKSANSIFGVDAGVMCSNTPTAVRVAHVYRLSQGVPRLSRRCPAPDPRRLLQKYRRQHRLWLLLWLLPWLLLWLRLWLRLLLWLLL